VRKAAIALMSAIVAGLMLAPNGLAAGTSTTVVQDMRGDQGPKLDFSTGEMLVAWPDVMVLKKVGYFDILSFSLSYSTKEKTYTFGMEVAKDLPASGSGLPTGWKLLRWLMWIDTEPWFYGVNDPTVYTVQLTFDGSAYAAQLKDYQTGAVLETLPFEVRGSTLKVEFSAASIGNMDSFWWMPCTAVHWSGAGYWDLDTTDPGAAPGQVMWDIPWPAA
jgi:hypothetical protein